MQVWKVQLKRIFSEVSFYPDISCCFNLEGHEAKYALWRKRILEYTNLLVNKIFYLPPLFFNNAFL